MAPLVPFTAVARDFSELVLTLNPAQSDWSDLDARCHALLGRLADLKTHVRGRFDARVSAHLEGVIDASAEDLSALLADPAERPRLYARLAQSYERMVHAFDSVAGAQEVSPAKLSPKNYARNLFHVTGGVAAALIYHFLLTQAQAVMVMLAISVIFSGLELGRRVWPRLNDVLMRFFAPLARPHEYYRMNSSTVYAYGLLAASALCPQEAVELGCVVLALADPAASNIGRRFGKKKLHRDKSWAGTIAFFAAGMISAAIYLALVHPEIPLTTRALAAVIAGVSGAIAELLSHRLDDNLTVPITVALSVALLF